MKCGHAPDVFFFFQYGLVGKTKGNMLRPPHIELSALCQPG